MNEQQIEKELDVPEMQLPKEERGKLFFQRVDALISSLPPGEEADSGSAQMAEALNRLKGSYESAYFGNKEDDEKKCWQILIGYETSSMEQEIKTLEELKESLKEEDGLAPKKTLH
jgi:hypothetical protein